MKVFKSVNILIFGKTRAPRSPIPTYFLGKIKKSRLIVRFLKNFGELPKSFKKIWKNTSETLKKGPHLREAIARKKGGNFMKSFIKRWPPPPPPTAFMKSIFRIKRNCDTTGFATKAQIQPKVVNRKHVLNWK